MKKLNTSKLSKGLSGVAGEYYAAAELSKRGYVASITLRNTKGVDILCTNEETYKTYNIQVKTNQGSKRKWILSDKAEKEINPNLFYVFVCLNDGEKHPDFFVVPSAVVAKYVTDSHEEFLKTPGKKGKIHKDSSMRNYFDLNEEYLNKWDLLHK